VKKFVAGTHGALASVEAVAVRWERKESGQLLAVEQAGSERTFPAQLALLAMGFLGPEPALLKALGTAVDSRGNIHAEHGKFTTSVKGVFAAGDCRRGQSLVVWAINEGRGAARECDRYLSAQTALP
jgi:glutamate synthase (NADPH/NADH) small chain